MTLAEILATHPCRDLQVGDPCWCAHHDYQGRAPLEFLVMTGAERLRQIVQEKPEEERAARLAAFRPVKGALPPRMVEAWKAYDEAGKACVETWKAYAEARKARDEAGKAYDEARKARDEAGKACVETWKARTPELLVQHRAEYPDSPWDDAKGRLSFKVAS